MLYSREKKERLVTEVNKCAAGGLRDSRIAELLGISTQTIRRWRQEGIVANGAHTRRKRCACRNEVQPEQQTIVECECEREPEKKRMGHVIEGEYMRIRYDIHGYSFVIFCKPTFEYYEVPDGGGIVTGYMSGKELGGKLLDMQAELQQIIQFIRR